MKFAVLIACALLVGCAATDARPRPRPAEPVDALPTFAERADVMTFAVDVARRRGLNVDWVQRQLAQARRLATVQRLVMPPPVGVAKNWAAYRTRFVEPKRIAAGVDFWLANQAALERAQAQFGVPPAVIVGVIGVETFYGRIMGTFRTLDALATLAFDFPPGRRDRSAFFRDELEELLVLATRNDLDLDALTGSYAGAVGLPQFMPGSINRYAIDYDGDGHVDLAGSAADAIGSVANYLAAFGWRRGMPIRFAVNAPEDDAQREVLLAPDIVPAFSPAEFARRGAVLRDAAAREFDGPLALVKLENGDDAPSYVAGTDNFYVITRYNWSSYYAMAVIELGEAVASEVGR